MSIQQNLFDSLRVSRVATLAFAALETTRARADVAARFVERRLEKRVGEIKGSLGTLSVAGRALEKVARRHGAKFVKQNATIAAAARDDLATLARETIDSLTKRGVKKARKPARKVASRRVARAA